VCFGNDRNWEEQESGRRKLEGAIFIKVGRTPTTEIILLVFILGLKDWRGLEGLEGTGGTGETGGRDWRDWLEGRRDCEGLEGLKGT